MAQPAAAKLQTFVKQLVGAPVMFSSEQKWGWEEYAGRLVYLVINTAILTLVLMGVISISEAGG